MEAHRSSPSLDLGWFLARIRRAAEYHIHALPFAISFTRCAAIRLPRCAGYPLAMPGSPPSSASKPPALTPPLRSSGRRGTSIWISSSPPASANRAPIKHGDPALLFVNLLFGARIFAQPDEQMEAVALQHALGRAGKGKRGGEVAALQCVNGSVDLPGSALRQRQLDRIGRQSRAAEAAVGFVSRFFPLHRLAFELLANELSSTLDR